MTRFPVGRLLRSVVGWTLAVCGTTSLVSATGRILCLPPYWPSGYFLRCRPGGVAPALLRLVPDALLTTALLALPALPIGVAVYGVARAPGDWMRGRRRALAAGLVGAVLWVSLATRLEPGYLDFILGGYAIVLGALAGIAITLLEHTWHSTSRSPSASGG